MIEFNKNLKGPKNGVKENT